MAKNDQTVGFSIKLRVLILTFSSFQLLIQVKTHQETNSIYHVSNLDQGKGAIFSKERTEKGQKIAKYVQKVGFSINLGVLVLIVSIKTLIQISVCLRIEGPGCVPVLSHIEQ